MSDPEDEPIHDITGAREAAATTGTLIVADRGYQRWGNKPTNRHPTSMRSLLTGQTYGEGDEITTAITPASGSGPNTASGR